jgi:anti-sigma B factor antagonist
MPTESHFSVLPTGQVVVRPSGELDLATADTLADLLHCGTHLSVRPIVDLGGVNFMDATALAVLLRAHQRAARHGGGLILINPAKQVRRLLAITGTDGIWPIYDCIDEAVIAWQLCAQ